jgi:Zn-dependent protease
VETLYVLPILLFSVVVHEVAHGWTALRLGDPTARDLGRLTFNPIPHLDFIGSVAVPLLSLLSAGSIFIAWAKPVPVNPMYFQDRRRGDLLVSAAGPLSNLVVAAFCAVCYVVSVRLIGPMENVAAGFSTQAATFVIRMFGAGITLNIFLAVFNLIPVPPLDGSHVLAAFLPTRTAERFQQIGFFGIIVVIMLMRLPMFRDIIYAIVLFLETPYQWLISILL